MAVKLIRITYLKYESAGGSVTVLDPEIVSVKIRVIVHESCYQHAMAARAVRIVMISLRDMNAGL